MPCPAEAKSVGAAFVAALPTEAEDPGYRRAGQDGRRIPGYRQAGPGGPVAAFAAGRFAPPDTLLI